MIGQPEPGLHLDLQNAAYHGGPGLSNSGLRNLAKSPFHFYSRHLDPKRPKATAKPGQLEGNLAHCAVLEPLEFQKRYVIGPDVRANTNEWKAFVAANSSKEVIKSAQADVAQAQARMVRALPDVAELLSRGYAEASVFWYEQVIDADTGEVTKVLCRARPDWTFPANEDSVILVDLKTFSSCDPREFSRQVVMKGYAGQNAWYVRGYEAATGKKVVGFCFVVVEMEWPFAAAAYMLADEWVSAAARENSRLLQLYVKCLGSGTWPSYGDTIQLLQPPPWLAGSSE